MANAARRPAGPMISASQVIDGCENYPRGAELRSSHASGASDPDKVPANPIRLINPAPGGNGHRTHRVHAQNQA